MRVIVRRASDWCNKWVEEINDLNDILNIIQREGYSIIVQRHESGEEDVEYEVVIYDSYVE